MNRLGVVGTHGSPIWACGTTVPPLTLRLHGSGRIAAGQLCGPLLLMNAHLSTDAVCAVEDLVRMKLAFADQLHMKPCIVMDQYCVSALFAQSAPCFVLTAVEAMGHLGKRGRVSLTTFCFL